MRAPDFAIVGAGRVGGALGILLRRQGYRIRSVVCRSMERAEAAARLIGEGTPHTDCGEACRDAGAIILSVPDRALLEVLDRITEIRSFGEDDLLIHTSGALPADVMRSQRTGAARCVSVHPVMPVADPVLGAEILQGAAFGVEGDPDAVDWAEKLVREIGGRPLRIGPGAKALYHAAACVSSNFLVALVETGLTLYEMAGIARHDGMKALLPLLDSTVRNIEALGVPGALTGPIERGDAGTVARHRDALRESNHPDAERIEALYRVLGLYTLGLASQKRQADSESALRLVEDVLKGMKPDA